MEAFTIGEVAKRAGVRTSTLRYYESVGLLPAPRRVYGGHRRYDAEIFQRLAVLRIAKRAGLTVAEMHLLVAGFAPETAASERWQVVAQKKLREVDDLLLSLQQTRQTLEDLLRCECQRLEECAQYNPIV